MGAVAIRNRRAGAEAEPDPTGAISVSHGRDFRKNGSYDSDISPG